jgi:hypothetical protein
MARGPEPIAQVRLTRSLPRLLIRPLILVAVAVAIAAAGILVVGGVAGIAMAAAGAVLVIVAAVIAAAALSVRVQVEESVVRVTGLFSQRVFLLTPGSLTRIHLRGEDASSVRTGFTLGWANGRAMLHDEEEIHLVRVGPADTAILVPTARGRLAIVTSDEPHLIDALSRAARARARTEELAAANAAEEAIAAEEAAAAARAVSHTPGAEAPRELDPRFMTGIERSLYEERLARERAAAAAAAARTVDTAPIDTVEPAGEPTPPTEAPAADAVPARGGVFRRPSWAQRRPGASAAGLPALPAPGRPSLSVPSVSLRRPRPSWLLPVVPLVAAGVAWGAAVYLGSVPVPGSPTARLTALALVLAGPGTTVAAIMARAWWPRLVGVVVAGGLASAIFIGRSLLPI